MVVLTNTNSRLVSPDVVYSAYLRISFLAFPEGVACKSALEIDSPLLVLSARLSSYASPRFRRNHRMDMSSKLQPRLMKSFLMVVTAQGSANPNGARNNARRHQTELASEYAFRPPLHAHTYPQSHDAAPGYGSETSVNADHSNSMVPYFPSLQGYVQPCNGERPILNPFTTL